MLQKFYKMICDIIVSKTMCGIFLIFSWSSFIDNFMVMNSFSEPKSQWKLNISRPVYFEKISAQHLVGFICTNKPEGHFFDKFFFQGLGTFLTTPRRLIWASFFTTKKYLYTFFRGWLFDFNIILRTCFKNSFTKTKKKWWFYSFK